MAPSDLTIRSTQEPSIILAAGDHASTSGMQLVTIRAKGSIRICLHPARGYLQLSPFPWGADDPTHPRLFPSSSKRGKGLGVPLETWIKTWPGRHTSSGPRLWAGTDRKPASFVCLFLCSNCSLRTSRLRAYHTAEHASPFQISSCGERLSMSDCQRRSEILGCGRHLEVRPSAAQIEEEVCLLQAVVATSTIYWTPNNETFWPTVFDGH